MFLFRFLAILSLTAASCTVKSDLLEFSTLTESFDRAVTCENDITSCITVPRLPPGLTLSSNCGISGKSKSIHSQKKYTVKYVNDGALYSGSITLVAYGTLSSCTYGVKDGIFSISKSEAFTIQPPRCNAPIKNCTASVLPTGVKIDKLGKIYTEGVTEESAQQTYTIICRDDKNEVEIPLKLSIGSNSGSTPLQYFQYPAMDFPFFKTRQSSITPNYLGRIKPSSCRASSSIAFPAGITMNGNTCIISGKFTGVANNHLVTVTAISENDHSTCSFNIYIRYISDAHLNYQHGWLIMLYRFEGADCRYSYDSQSSGAKELLYVGVRDYVNYTAGKSLWPEYGWHLEEQSSLSSIGFYHGDQRTFFGFSGPTKVYYNDKGENWPRPKPNQFSQSCSIVTSDLIGGLAGRAEIHQYRGVGADNQFRYEVQVGAASGGAVGTGVFIGPDKIAHQYLGFLEYNLMKAVYPAHTPIPANKPVLQAWVTARKVNSYEIDRDLPIGLELDTKTGYITGYTDEIIPSTLYTVTMRGVDTTANNAPFTFTCQLDLEIREFTAPEDQFDCDLVTVEGREDFKISPITCTSKNSMKIIYHSTDLPKGLSLSEDGVISGIAIEQISGHASTIYGYTINGVTAKQITFHIKPSCEFNKFYFIYNLETPGTLFTIKQGDEILFANTADDELGIDIKAVVCAKLESSLKLIINSNSLLGGKFKLIRDDLVIYTGKVEDIIDQREIDIEFPLDEVPVVTYPDLTELIVGFDYYMSPIVKNGASLFEIDTIFGGLSFDKETGAIYGTVTSAISNPIVVHVTATNSHGKSEVTDVTLRSSKCEGDRQLFKLSVNVGEADSGIASIVVTKKSDQSVIFSANQIISTTFNKSFCDTQGDYTATYTFTSVSSIEIELEGLGITTPLSPGTNSVQDFFVQRVYTGSGIWYYTSTYYPDWITMTEFDGWFAAPVGGFQEPSGIVRYYKYGFKVPDTQLSNAIMLSLTYAGGIATYINNHLVYLNNLPDNYTSESESIGSTAIQTVKIPVTKSYFKVDGSDNYISIECHFQSSMNKKENLNIDMQYMGINQCVSILNKDKIEITAFAEEGVGTVTDKRMYERYLPDAFKNAMYNLHSTGGGFSYDFSGYNAYGNTWFKYIYPYPVLITQYYMSSDNVANTYSVSWDVLGSNDNNEWNLLHSMRRSAQPKANEDKSFFIPNINEHYKYYLFNITSRGENGQALAPTFRMTGMLPSMCNYPKSCDDIPMGSNSYFMCPEGQESNVKTATSEPIRIVRECRNVNGFPTLQPDNYGGNTCSKVKIVFDASNNKVTGIVGKEVPTYRAFLSVDRETTTTITSDPQLPAGIKIDQLSGRIYGIPTEGREAKAYTITVTNDAYPEGARTISRTINLEVLIPKCPASEDGIWPETEINIVANISCGLEYFGEMTRECKLDENGDPQWSEIDRSGCSDKVQTNCRYSSDEVSFDLYEKGTYTCTCDDVPTSIRIEPELPNNWRLLETGSIQYVIDNEFDIDYTITFVSKDGFEQVVKLRITSLPKLESCSYGFDNNELKLYKMYVDIAGPKCVGYFTSASVSSSTPLPDGLVLNGRTGAISGYLTNEIPTEGVDVNIVIADAKNSITLTLKFKKNDEGNLLTGFRAYGMKPYSASEFSNELWSKLFDGSKTLSGPTIMTKSVYPETSDDSPDFPSSEMVAIRAEGYLKITEAGNYVIKYRVKNNGNVVIPGFKDIKTPSTAWDNVQTTTVSLKPGYVYTGLFLGLDGKPYSTDIQIKKESEADGSYKDLSGMMYRGGFIIQHVDYSSFSYIIMARTDYKIIPTFEGVPSKWRISPSVNRLTFDENTGIISGQIDSCEGYTTTTFTVTSYSDDGLSSSSDSFRIICVDETVELLKGLNTIVYTINSPNLDGFTDPTTSGGLKKILEIIDNPNHVRSDDIWNGFSLLSIYSFIADYNGFIKVEQLGDYVITMKCYDYCRLYLARQDKTIEITGRGYDIKTINVNFAEIRYYPIRITYTKGSDDIAKQLEVNIVSSSLEIESQPIDKFLYHTPKAVVEYKTSYIEMYETESVDIELNSFQVDLTDAKFKVNPSLPTGLSLTSDGRISGTPSRETDLLEYKLSVTFSNGDTDSSSIWMKVLKNEKSELKYPAKITASTGSEVNVGPTNFTNCIGFTVNKLPNGFTMNSKTGYITGKGMSEYREDITVTCLSSNPVTSTITFEISGCGSGNSFFTFEYLINSNPEGVSFEIGYNNLVIFPPEGYDVIPEVNKNYKYGTCIISTITYKLNIKCKSSSGYVKLYYGDLLIKYIEFSSDDSYSFQMKDHSNEKPRFEYENKNVLGFVKNLKMTFSPVLVYNGANEYSYIGTLPDGIKFDVNTGALSGTLTSTDISTSLTITATNNYGDSDEVKVEIRGIICPNEGFKIRLLSDDVKRGTDELPYKPFYYLWKSSSLLSNISLINQRDISNLYCLESGSYKLTFGNLAGTTAWKFSEILVYMLDEEDNEETIVRDYYRGGNEEGNSIDINFKKYLSPSTKWSYSDVAQTSESWKEGLLEGEVLEGPVFNEMTKITRYYITQFDFGDEDSINDISSFIINLKFEGGMILYINGDEYYRYNLPSGEITSETPATSNNDLKNRKIKGPISLFNIGINTIAIEIHRTTSDVKGDSFISKSLYITSGMESCIYDKYEITEIEGNYRDQEYKPDKVEDREVAENLIDGNLGTKMYVKGAHNDAYLQFDFTEDYYQYFNSYIVRGYHETSDTPSREIGTFSVYAEDENDGNYLLGSNSEKHEEPYKRYKPDVISTKVPLKPMKSMRIEFETESSGGEFTDVLPAVCRNMCLRDGKWSPAYIGTKSKINCGFNTEAGDERECLDMNGSPMWGDEIEICSKRCNDNDEYGIGVPGGESKQYNCGNGYNGYTYKYCSMVEPVEYSEVKRDKCIGWYPSSVTYSSVEGYVGKTSIKAEPNFVKDSELSLSFRRKDGSEELPNGLSIDSESGIISGIIAEDASAKTYHMTIEIVGTRTIESEFDIVVKDVTCPIDSGFPATKIGETAVIPCVIGEENDKNKTRYCTFDEAIKAPKWGIIDASACGSTAIPVVKYSNEGKMIFTIDVESSSEIPEKTDVTKLELNDLDGLKTNYGLIFDIATGEVFGKCKKEDRDVEYTVTAYNGETKGDDVTIKITCEYGKPESILYDKSNVIAYIGGKEITLTPIVVGHASSYKINPNNELEAIGIVFDTTTGIIVINAKSDLEMSEYTINACNGENCASTKVSIDLRYKRPESISYPQNEYVYTIGDSVELIPVEEKQEGVKYEIIPLSILTNIGLSFDDKTGKLSGRVSKALSKSDFTLKAYNRDGESTFTFSFAVAYGEPPDIKYANDNVVVFATEYTLIEKPAESSDSSLVFTIEPDLPTGLFMIQGTGRIEGILENPFEAQLFTVTVRNDLGVKNTTITLKGIWPAPKLLVYQPTDIKIAKGEEYESAKPLVSDHITLFESEPPLPSPFTINQTNGVIYTTSSPISDLSKSSYMIIASNEAGKINTTITIAVTNPPPVIVGYIESSVTFVIGVEKRVEGPRKAEGSVIDKFSMNTDTLKKITECGLTFSEVDGSISGKATSSLESTTATVFASNDGGDGNSVQITIMISEAPPQNLEYADPLKLYIGIANNVGPIKHDSSITSYRISDDDRKFLLNESITFLTESGEFNGQTKTVFDRTVTVSGCDKNGICVEATVNINSVYPKPGTLGYASQTMKAIIGETFSSGIPTKNGQVNEIKEGENFPSEFKLDHNTGEITGEGYTTRIYPAVKFTVITSNAEGDTPTDLSLEVIYPKPTKVEYTSNNFTFTQTEYSETSEATTDAEYIIEYSYSPVTLAQYGLEFEKSTGKIFGSATKYSSTPLTYTITATNADGSAKTQIKIYMVYPAPKSVSYKNENMVFTMGLNTVSEKPVVEGTATSFTIEPDVSLYGLKFNTKTGQVSGNSEIELKKTEFTVTAINEKGSVDTTITITINYPKPTKISYGIESMKMTLGQKVSYKATINAGGYKVSVKPALPSGLEIDEKTGTIEGTPTELLEEAKTYTVTVTNSGGSASVEIAISVLQPLVTDWKYNVPTKPNSPFTLLVNFGEEFDSGIPTYKGHFDSLTIDASNLESEGFTVDESNGRIRGKAKNNNKEVKFTINAINSGGSQRFTITLNIYFPLPKSLSYTNPLVAIVNEPIEPASPKFDGEMQSAFSFMPAYLNCEGLSMSQTGIITGTTTTEYDKVIEISYGNYDRGFIKFNLTIISTKPSCLSTGKWPVTNYGSIATILCDDPLIGFKTRYCYKNNITGAGEWGSIVDGCVKATPVIENNIGKVLFNLTLQGKPFSVYGDKEVVAIAEVIVRLINKAEINVTNTAVVLQDASSRRRRILQTDSVIAKTTVTAPLKIAKEVKNEISTLSDMGIKVIDEFSKSSNDIIRTIDYVEVSQPNIVARDENGDSDSSNSEDATLYIIIGASCGGFVLILLLICGMCCYCRMKSSDRGSSGGSSRKTPAKKPKGVAA